jgi:copper resistance protein C
VTEKAIRILLAVVLLTASPAAWAHAFLAGAAPAAGSQFPTAPPHLMLRFTEPVEPSFCTIQLLSPTGAPIALAAPKAAEDARALIIDLPPLASGTYTVIWHATSVDTHKTEGRHQFTIGP